MKRSTAETLRAVVAAGPGRISADEIGALRRMMTAHARLLSADMTWGRIERDALREAAIADFVACEHDGDPAESVHPLDAYIDGAQG